MSRYCATCGDEYFEEDFGVVPACSKHAGLIPMDNVVALITERLCQWCRVQLQPTAPPTTLYCGRKCRQAAWRLSQHLAADRHAAQPKRMAYADPPYPGLSAKYYSDEPTFAGEVDHPALVSRLEQYDGWALSTSSRALSDILPLCPRSARVCPWVKPNLPNHRAHGIASTWEAVIVVSGRSRRRPIRDTLYTSPARGGGADLMGRKPIAFCAWLFELLGLMPGDTFDDLFPGTGIVTQCWRSHCRRCSAGATPSLVPGHYTRPKQSLRG